MLRTFFAAASAFAALLLAVPSAVAQPGNDNFVSAVATSGRGFTTIASNVEATAETGEPSHAGTAAQTSAWWRWT